VTAKKRSFLILKPTRDLVLFRDGSFAYFNPDNKMLKAHIKPAQMKKVTQKGSKLDLACPTKTYHFFFSSEQEASMWSQQLNQN